MTNKELQEAINETFQQTKTHTGVEKHKAEERLKELRRVQLERAKEWLYELHKNNYAKCYRNTSWRLIATTFAINL